jgi:hypothetical protein
MDKQLFRKLNAYDYNKYDEIMNTLQGNTASKSFSNKYQNFKVEDGVLKYEHKQQKPDGNYMNVILEVVREKDIDEKLQNIYDNPSLGMGKGINSFYSIVSSMYLNITKKNVIQFLNKQVSYQLTRPLTKPRHPTKKFNTENSAWAIDLIDVSQYKTVNRNNTFILSCVDLYSRRCYLRKLLRKTSVAVRDAMKTFCTENNKPKILYCDMGAEFREQFKTFIESPPISAKILTSASYTPVADIENLNGQVRKLMSELFVRNANLVWYPHLQEIEDNINNFNNLPKIQLKRLEAKHNRLNADNNQQEQKFTTGMLVRISQKAIVSDVRQRYKQGTQKSVHNKWSISTYIIARRYKPTYANGFNSYGLKFQNNQWVQNAKFKVMKFREGDLQQVPTDRVGRELTIQENNKINKM